MLNDFKVAGRSQPKSLYFAVIDFVFDGFVNALGRQRPAWLSLVTRLSAAAWFPSSLGFFRFGLGLVIPLEGGLEEVD